MKMSVVVAAFFIGLLSTISNAGRTYKLPNDCLKCQNTVNDGLFEAGYEYVYSYQGESEVKTNSKDYDTTGVMMRSKVVITALSSCSLKMTLTDVELLDKNSKTANTFSQLSNNKNIQKMFVQNAIYFTRKDGRVDSVCVSEEEPIWVENVKKAIIDSLANKGEQTKQNSIEKTIHGQCYIDSKTVDQPSSNYKTVSIKYNILSCGSDYLMNSFFAQVSKYSIFNASDVSCQYVYQNRNELLSVNCQEKYSTTPAKQMGNKINVDIKTRFERKSKNVAKSESIKNLNLIKTTIERRNEELPAEQSSMELTKQTLRSLCDEQINSKIPGLFMTLVNQLKNLNSKEIKEIYLDLQKADICRNGNERVRTVFYDAVSFVNTPAASSVMVELIKKKLISATDTNIWYTSLQFMKDTPTYEMLKDLETLLGTEEFNNQLYLGVSGVAKLYCQANYESCLNDATIKNILSLFLNNLKNDCSDDNAKVQISLKSIENMRVYTPEVMVMLDKCLSKASNPMSVKISSLQAIKHSGCEHERSTPMKILENNENDSELRIQAYLTIMGCADVNTVFKVRQILQKEQVNQVGSFIWTHLTNIQETSDFVKRDIKELLRDVELRKVFNLDKLKYSRNIEKTFDLNDAIGMTFDSNLIFSEKSFIPRSISLNTTSRIFGMPTNFIEMSGRMEGTDDLMFKLLGPDGYFKKGQSDPVELMEMLNRVNGNFNFKLFGQQISFVELLRGTLSSVQKYDIVKEFMKFGDLKAIDFQKRLMLLDNSAVLPTILGLPLSYSIQGAVSIDLKVKSKFNLASLMSSPRMLDVENFISPQIASELSADVVMLTPFSKYGVKFDLKSSTNTEVKATILVMDKEKFEIKFDTPKDVQELVSIEGNSYVVYQDQLQAQLKDQMTVDEICTDSTMLRIAGLKVCGTMKYVRPDLRESTLLYGPFAGAIKITKVDTQSGYVLRGMSKVVPVVTEYGTTVYNRFFQLEFDTPKSTLFNRRFLLDFVLDHTKKQFALELQTPWNQAAVKGSYKLLFDDVQLGFVVQMNRQDIVKFTAKNGIIWTRSSQSVKGGVEVSLVSFSPINVSWKCASSKNEWKAEFKSEGILKEATTLELKVLRVKTARQLSLFDQFKLSGSYQTYFGKGEISGTASENYFGHRWDVKIVHNFRDNPNRKYILAFRHKTEDKSTASLLKFFLKTSLAYGESAENFISFHGEQELSDRHLRTSVKMKYRQGETGKTKEIEEELDLLVFGGFTRKGEKHVAEGSVTFKIPSKKLHYEGRYKSEMEQKLFKMSLIMDKDQQPVLNLKIDYVQPKPYLKDNELEISLSLPNHNGYLRWNLKEIDVRKFDYSLETRYNSHFLTVNGVQLQISNLNYESKMIITLPNVKQLPGKVKIGLRINVEDLANGIIAGDLEIPETIYKYSMDTTFSFAPRNFLKYAANEHNSVLKYNVKINGIENSIRSKFIFTINPEEFQIYKSYVWNLDTNPENEYIFNIHAVSKSPNNRQVDNSARFTLKFPGKKYSIGFVSEFRFTQMHAQVDLSWNHNKRITINTMYEIDNSWTQKGLTASITIKTPFAGYEMTHLGMNVVGQLRYRKIDIEYKWGNNKKLLLSLVIQPKSSSDFTLGAKLVTPFKGMTLVTFNVKHMYSLNSISTQCSVEIGPTRKYQVKFEAINNNDETKRDVMANLQIESGVIPPIKISLMHKDNLVHFETQFDASWMQTQSLNLKSKISISLADSEIMSNGDFEILSTIPKLEQFKTFWSVERRNGNFKSNVKVGYNFQSLLQSDLKGFYEKEDYNHKIEVNGMVKLAGFPSIKVTKELLLKPSFASNRFSVEQDSVMIYSHDALLTESLFRMKIKLPETKFKIVEIEATMNVVDQILSTKSWFKIGENYLFKESTSFIGLFKSQKEVEMEMKSQLYSDYLNTKTFNVKYKMSYPADKFTMFASVSSSSDDLFKLDLIANKGRFTGTLKTSFEQVRNAEFGLLLPSVEPNKPITFEIAAVLNDFTMKFNTKVERGTYYSVKLDYSVTSRTINSYFKFVHECRVNGYEQLLDTNLLGNKIKLEGSIRSRGGLMFGVDIKTNTKYFEELGIVGRMSKDERMLTIVYVIPHNTKEVLKFSFHQRLGKINVDFNTKSFGNCLFRLDLNEAKQILFDLNVSPKFQIKFQYNGGLNAMEHFNFIKILFAEKIFELENKVKRVKWKYLQFESKMNTNVSPKYSSYKIGIEYNIKPNTFDTEFKAFLNENFVKFVGRLYSRTDVVLELKLETSFAVLKQIVVDIKAKQNKFPTNALYSIKLVSVVYDSMFQFENSFEWDRWNYIVFEMKLAARTSKDNYVISPKSLKISHQYVKDVLKELLTLTWSETNFKMKMEVPLKMKSQSFFELTHYPGQLGKVRTELDFDFLSKGQRSVSLKVERNLELLISGNVLLKTGNDEISITNSVEYSDTFKNNFNLKIYQKIPDKVTVKGSLDNSLLKRKIDVELFLDRTARLGKADVKGLTKNPISISVTFKKDLIETKLTSEFANGLLTVSIEPNSIKGKVSVSSKVSFEFQGRIQRTPYELYVKVNEHDVTLTVDEKYATNVMFNILKVKGSAKVNFDYSPNNLKVKAIGETNIPTWNKLDGELIYKKESGSYSISSKLVREQTTIYDMGIKHSVMKSLELTYQTYVGSGSLKVDYSDFPTKFSIEAKSSNSNEKLNVDVKIESSKVTGTIETPFSFAKTVKVVGQITGDKNKFEGSVSLILNDPENPITAKINYANEKEKLSIDVSTPFPSPFNKLGLTYEYVPKEIRLELTQNDDVTFKLSYVKSSSKRYELNVDVKIPKKIIGLEFLLSGKLDLESPIKVFETSMKSNLFSDSSLTLTCNPTERQYTIQFSNPTKGGEIVLKHSQDSNGNKFKFSSKVNDLFSTIELQYKIPNVHNVLSTLTVTTNAYFGKETSFEVRHSHVIDVPNALNVNFALLSNDRFFYRKSLAWKKTDKSFDFSSKVILTPYEKDYESSIQISNKQNEMVNFVLKIAEVLKNDIRVEVVNQLKTQSLKIRTPCELIREIDVILKKDDNSNGISQTLTVSSNVIGKYEMSFTRQQLSNGDAKINVLFDTPKTAKAISTEIVRRNKVNDEMIELTVEVFGKKYDVNYKRNERELTTIKIGTPYDWVRMMEFSITKNSPNAIGVYGKLNDLSGTMIVSTSDKSISIDLTSSLSYFQLFTITLQNWNEQTSPKTLSFTMKKDSKIIQMKTVVDLKMKRLNCEMKNELFDFMPNSLLAAVQLSTNPLDVALMFQANGLSLFDFKLNKDQLTFEQKLPVFLRFSLKKSEMEFVLLDEATFSIFVKGDAWKKVEARINYRSDQYDVVGSLDRIMGNVQLIIRKNKSYKLLLVETEFLPKRQFIQFEINRFEQPILKWKLTNDIDEVRKSSLEIKILSINIVVDLTADIKPDLSNLRLSWNLMKNEQQLHLGSFALVLKNSNPINYSMLFGLQTGDYQFQILELENKEIQLKLQTPFNGIDLDLNVRHFKDISKGEYGCECQLKNGLIGKYQMKALARITMDPELTLALSSDQPILSVRLLLKRSVANEYSISAQMQILNMKKTEFHIKLVNKDLIELLVTLKTPFDSLKRIHLMKKLRYQSWLEHNFDMEISYDGIAQIVYRSGHEISMMRKVFRYESRFQKELVDILSLNINHLGGYDDLDHSIVWVCRNRKYGLRLLGSFQPTFNGKAEIFTPYHQIGKFVIVGQQTRSGFRLLADKDGQRISMLQYHLENDRKIFKVAPMKDHSYRVDIQSRRTRRSVENHFNSEINYGDKNLLKLKSKFAMEKDKYSTRLNVDFPFVLNKPAELFWTHQNKDNAFQFDHHLKTSDNVDPFYRTYGKLDLKNPRNINWNFNTETQKFGNIGFSFGHSVLGSSHKSHFRVKRNQDDLLNYMGLLNFDENRNDINGNWKFQTPTRFLEVNAGHQRQSDDFLQSLDILYNNDPIIRYKGSLNPSGKSEIGIDLSASKKVSLIFDRKENRFDAKYNNGNRKYLLKMINNDGHLKLTFDDNDQNVGLLSIGYGKQPLFFEGKYYENTATVELTLADDRVRLVAASSLKTKLNILLTRNQITGELTINDTPYQFQASYHYAPDSFYVLFESSFTIVAKISFHATPNELKINWNKYFLVSKYVFKKTDIRLSVDNNLSKLFTSFQFEFQTDLQKSTSLTVKCDAMSFNATVEHSKDRVLLKSNNNVFSVKTIEIDLSRQLMKEDKFWIVKLKIDEHFIGKTELIVKGSFWAFGIETNKKATFITSWDRTKNQLIFSGVVGDKFVHFIMDSQQMISDKRKTIFVKMSINSSYSKLRKITKQFKMAIDGMELFLSNEVTFDKAQFGMKIHLSKSFGLISAKINENEYTTSIKKTDSGIVLNGAIPGSTVKVTLESQTNEYVSILSYNDKEIVKVVLKQKFDLKTSIEHESIVYYQNKKIYNMKFFTDFKEYQLQIIDPIRFEIKLKNDWRKDDVSLGIWLKTEYYKMTIEKSAGIDYKSSLDLWSWKIFVNNGLHVITVSQKSDKVLSKEMFVELKNIISQNVWSVSNQRFRSGDWKIQWTTPTKQRYISLTNQFQNNIRTLFELDIFGDLKVSIKRSEKTGSVETGSVVLFQKKIASIIIDRDAVEVIFNENQPESDKLFLRWEKKEQGLWLKNYLAETKFMVKQKKFDVDIEIVTKIRMEKYFRSVLTTLQYKGMDKDVRKVDFGYEFDISMKNKIQVNVISPLISMKTILKREIPTDSILRYEMETIFDNEQKISGFWQLSLDKQPGITIKFYYNPSDVTKFIQFHSKYLDARQFEIRLFTDSKKNLHDYFHLYVGVMNEKLIKTQFLLRRSISTDFQKTLYRTRAILTTKWEDFAKVASKIIRKEFLFRFKQMNSILPDSVKMNERLVSMRQQYLSEVQSFNEEIFVMIYRNEFFLSTTSDVANILTLYSVRMVRFAVVTSTRFIDSTLDWTIRTIKRIFKIILVPWNTFYRMTDVLLDNVSHFYRMKFQPILRHYLPIVQDYFTYALVELKTGFVQYIVSVWKYPLIIKQYSKYYTYKALNEINDKFIKLMETTVGKLVAKSMSFLQQENELKSVYRNLLEKLEEYSENLKTKIEVMANMLDGSLVKIGGDRSFQKFGKSVTDLFDVIIKQLKDEANQNRFRDAVMDFVDIKILRLKNKLKAFVMETFFPKIAYICQFGGKDEIELSITYVTPIPVYDLKSLPDFGYVNKRIEELKNIYLGVRKIIQERLATGQRFVEFMKWFTPSFPSTSFSILPEFERYATISGSSIVTFDKRSFSLTADPCKVVLAEDLRFKQWEITHEQTKTARIFSVKIRNTKISISLPDHKVTLNGKPADLPIKDEFVSLIAFGRVMKITDESIGISVTLDAINNIITVAISGWYHGQVRGLFGNSDNEPFNDMMLENNKIVKSDEFLEKFQRDNVGKCKLQSTNKPLDKPAKNCPFLRRMVCSFVFKCSFSPMASCFNKVDPTGFFEKCLSQTSEMQMKFDSHICAAARDYQSQCQKAGVVVAVPYPCKKCNIPNEKPILVNEFKTLKVKQKAADIVFVIDEGKCLDSIKSRVMDIAVQLNTSMVEKGITSIKFGLVTFAGEGIDVAHSHTVSQELFGSAYEMVQTLRRLKGTPTTTKDITGALELASKYPFREYASKHVITISCNSCGYETSLSKSVHTKLSKRSIQFSLLTDFTFELKSNLKKVIFGIDSQKLYTPLSRSGESIPKGEVAMPKIDFCFDFAMNLKGVAFDLKFLSKKKSKILTMFVDSFTNQVTQRAKPVRTSKCVCADDAEYICSPLDVHTIFPAKKN